MRPLRIWLVGTGTVGTWLAGVLGSQRERLAASYGLSATVVGAASARGGFVYDAGGLDLASLPAAAARARAVRPAVGGTSDPDGPVDSLPQQVGVPVVPGVLVYQVEHHQPQRHVLVPPGLVAGHVQRRRLPLDPA